MNLTQKPFKKLYANENDKWIQKLGYHLHRAVEAFHHLEKEYYKDENLPKFAPDDPTVVVNERH